jgi:hypothetical protein
MSIKKIQVQLDIPEELYKELQAHALIDKQSIVQHAAKIIKLGLDTAITNKKGKK